MTEIVKPFGLLSQRQTDAAVLEDEELTLHFHRGVLHIVE